MTNYEKIKAMSVEEMAAFLTTMEIEKNPKTKRKLKKCKESWLARYVMAMGYMGYLKSEVEE